MAAQAAGISVGGRINNAGTERILHLILYAGELLTQFERFTFMDRLVRKRPLSGAKTLEWRAMGRITGLHHTRGNNVWLDSEADNFNHVKRPVTADNVLLVASMVDELDKLLADFEEREPYMTEMGRYLATTYDVYQLIAALRGARTNITNSATLVPADATDGSLNGGYVGNVDTTTPTTPAAKGAVLLDALFAAQQLLNEKDVPDEDRFVPLRPSHYNWLVRNRELLDRDFGNEGNGIFFDGTLFVGAGFGLIRSNNIPSTNITVNPTGANNTYTGNFLTTHTVAFQRGAVGVVEVMAPSIDIDWYSEYRTWGMIGELVQGTAPVRYEACVELNSLVTQPSL